MELSPWPLCSAQSVYIFHLNGVHAVAACGWAARMGGLTIIGQIEKLMAGDTVHSINRQREWQPGGVGIRNKHHHGWASKYSEAILSCFP